MTRYRFTSPALTELAQAILYYEQRENGLGTAFLNEILIAFYRIQPLGTSCPHEQDAVELTAFRLA